MVDNVITVSIGNSRKITSRPVWLTDKGMILKFVGVDLPNYYVVDFARSVTDQALPVIGDADGVAIPSELFHNADKIFAWLRLTKNDNVHYTVYQIIIPLLQRSEISESQPTPEQEDIIDQAIAALNAAGTEAAAAAESAAQSAAEIDGKLGGGGIDSVSYETLFGGEFAVTTATDAEHEHPWARASVTGRLDKRYKYRVTFDGTTYILPSQLFDYDMEISGTHYIKVLEYIGNSSLFRLSDAGLLNEPNNVPFLIVSDDPGGSVIDVYTQEAGEHTAIIERVVENFERIDNSLIYGSNHEPFQSVQKTSTYDSASFGVNRIASGVRGSFAAGFNNFIKEEFCTALGSGNVLSAKGAFAAGAWCSVTGSRGFAEGFSNTAGPGSYSHVKGQRSIAAGACSSAEGDGVRAYGRASHVEGGGTYSDASQEYVHVGGVNNAVSQETGKTVSITRYNADGEAVSTGTRQLGKYAEVIGNGDSDQARSNARTLDWEGNEALAGGLTLGMGTEDEIHITPVQLKALLNLI